MTVHGEQIIGLEVPYKDLSPMVRAAMSEKKPEKLKINNKISIYCIYIYLFIYI